MLFDLRGRGRRRTVRVVYSGLAVLIGVGLIGFGIGGGLGGGGLFTAASENEGASSASFANQIKKYQKLISKQPKNVSAWEGLVSAQLHEAGGEAYVSNGKLTGKGKELFSQIAHSWNSYLALNPPKPSLALAKEVVRVFGEEGLNQPAEAVQALQIVVAGEPQSAALFGSLAEYSYKAKNTRQGDLAAAKAVSLAPAAQRTHLKQELAELKKSAEQKKESAELEKRVPGSQASTVTSGGQPVEVKQGTSGTATATATTSTPTPAGHSSTGKK
jgi:hypothetical protein